METSDTIIKPIGEGRTDALKRLGPHFDGKWPQRVICTFEGNDVDRMAYVPEPDHSYVVMRLTDENEKLLRLIVYMYGLLEGGRCSDFDRWSVCDMLERIGFDSEDLFGKEIRG